mmetsp:Transcript_27483/g.41775  ORF Transcript_27483/g.41775 Transcript_27483/m.41775 type:complete len:80 (-) Transcript_27483:18-257(-)
MPITASYAPPAPLTSGQKSQAASSVDAPGHKGMLARAMEKDMKEQAQREQKEKDDLMSEAMNDPTFKMQLEALKSQQGM